LTNKIYDAAFGRRGMRFARHFNAFHVINEEDLEFLEKHNFNPSFLIPNGVNTDFFTPCNKNNIFKILFVRRFIEGKGVLRLKSINSAINKIIENYKIILVGEGSCKNRVMSEMQNDNIIFRGWVTGTPLKELFCTSHVLLVPSLDESFSLVTLESLSSGTPVVGSNIVPLNKNIESGINGYLGDDDKALADGILKIYNTWKSDPEGYSKMSSLCREKARKFDWVNEIVPRLSNMLDSL
jgi:glycosyltransferase involved in cell wall biosynthesis